MATRSLAKFFVCVSLLPFLAVSRKLVLLALLALLAVRLPARGPEEAKRREQASVGHGTPPIMQG